MRPLAGGGRSRRSHAGRLLAPPSSLASAPRTTDPAHMATPVAGFGSFAADDGTAKRKKRHAVTNPRFVKIWTRTPVRAGA